MNILITQSNYIPWKGYFDSIAKADVFVVYDDMQYTRRDWRNRNLIKTNTGLNWLTIPVQVKGKFTQLINETVTADENWQKNHLVQLRHNYSKANCFNAVFEWVENLYNSTYGFSLSETNIFFLKEICLFLGIRTKFMNSKEFKIEGNRNEKLVNICNTLGGKQYLTGPAAKEYIDERLFYKNNISVEYLDYGGYVAYPQLYPPFEHGVSILDLIFNCGVNAKKHMKYLDVKP